MLIKRGLHSIVIRINKSKVLKIFLDKPDHYTDTYLKYAHGTGAFVDVVPTVYKDFKLLGLRMCVMEYLEVRSDKCLEYLQILTQPMSSGKILLDLIKDYDYRDYIAHVEYDSWDIVRWALKVKHILEEIGLNDLFPGDFTIDNIGERSNGDIVYFDP